MLDKHSESGAYGDHGKAETVSSDIPLTKQSCSLHLYVDGPAGLIEKYASGA